MKPFIHEDFLLTNSTAINLYHDYAKKLPIIDYHSHLDPKEIAENCQFENVTKIWLEGDHYKWRAMRNLGISETFITGDADDFDKFKMWAKTVPYCIGNPLYHWTHLELKRYFDVDIPLNKETSQEIWEHCNNLLKKKDLSVHGILEKFHVEMIGTTDDPVDSLEYHKSIRNNHTIKAIVLPTFRPDPYLAVSSQSFLKHVNDLCKSISGQVRCLDDFLGALEERIRYFHENGCRISDHGIESLPYKDCSSKEAAEIFNKALEQHPISRIEEQKFTSFVMIYLGKLYSKYGWVMQLHIGAIRNNNNKMFKEIGPNTGFDSIHDFEIAKPLNHYLDALDRENHLPKTIIYNLNPTHNYVVASAAGNFHGEGVRGKVQFGAGWWFNDQKDGMLRQLTDLSNLSLLANFVGMLTDSRSFLSFTRHEYFRRILCDLIGRWVENGELPKDMNLLSKIVEDICYHNANTYFELEKLLYLKER